MRPALLVLLAPILAAADRVPAVTPTGTPRLCIPLSQIRQTLVRDDRTIDFVMTGRRVYRNVLPSACPQLGAERRLAYATSLGELCSTDTVTVLFDAPLMRGARCGLGTFQPVALTAR